MLEQLTYLSKAVILMNDQALLKFWNIIVA